MTSSTFSARPGPVLLAVDTSTWTCSVCLQRGNEPLVELERHNSRNHTKTLLELIETALRLADLDLSQIEAYVIGLGPGSFTGLRIGLSTLKGLAWSHGRPVVGVNSLDALSRNAPVSDGLVAVVQDARKREVYSCIYRMKGHEPERVADPAVVAPSSLCDSLNGIASPGESICILGSGLPLYRELFSARLPQLLPLEDDHPAHRIRACQLATLALPKLAEAPADISTLVPEYIRPSEAELSQRSKNK